MSLYVEVNYWEAGYAEGDGGATTGQTPAGRGSKTKTRRKVVEIDGQTFPVNSDAEAAELFRQLREAAEQKAQEAIERASKASQRPKRKVLADVRKSLQLPKIDAPDYEGIADRAVAEIKDLYASTINAVEIGALLRNMEHRRQAEIAAAEAARIQAELDDDEEAAALLLMYL